jgi:hypothetical protein
MKEEQDPVWQLLGRSRPQEPSAFFTSKVMQKIDEAEKAPAGLAAFRALFDRFWTFSARGCGAPAVVAAVLAVAMLSGLFVMNRPVEQQVAAVSEMKPVDFEVVVMLDELLAYEESSAWLDPQAL